MKRFRSRGGFTLIELLIVIIIIGIIAAIAIPMFLNQRDKAKEANVKEGVHSIQVGIESWAVDNNDSFPAVGLVNDTIVGGTNPALYHVGDYVDNWPNNMLVNPVIAMKNSVAAAKGDYSYTNPTTDTFKLIGWGKNLNNIIQVPK